MLTSAPSIASGMFLSAVPPPPTLPVQASLEGFSPKPSNIIKTPRKGNSWGLKRIGDVGGGYQAGGIPKGVKDKTDKEQSTAALRANLRGKKGKTKREKSIAVNDHNDVGLDSTAEVRKKQTYSLAYMFQ